MYNFIKTKIGLSRQTAVIIGGDQLTKIMKFKKNKKLSD